MITICKLYSGESVRESNGSQVGLPTFGKFAAIVREDWLAVCESDAGAWYIRTPNGCTLAIGEGSKDETLEHAQAIAAKGSYDHWTTNRDEAVAKAIEEAKARHNAKVAESAAYAEKFGSAV